MELATAVVFNISWPGSSEAACSAIETLYKASPKYLEFSLNFIFSFFNLILGIAASSYTFFCCDNFNRWLVMKHAKAVLGD